jgi:hypothetical protein
VFLYPVLKEKLILLYRRVLRVVAFILCSRGFEVRCFNFGNFKGIGTKLLFVEIKNFQ